MTNNEQQRGWSCLADVLRTARHLDRLVMSQTDPFTQTELREVTEQLADDVAGWLEIQNRISDTPIPHSGPGMLSRTGLGELRSWFTSRWHDQGTP
jgi:hypothetical protein